MRGRAPPLSVPIEGARVGLISGPFEVSGARAGGECMLGPALSLPCAGVGRLSLVALPTSSIQFPTHTTRFAGLP